MLMRRLLQGGILGVFLAMAHPAQAMNWPDTGQDKCYDNNVEIPCTAPGQPFYGQDAQYLGLARSYTKLDSAGNDLPASAASWTTVRDNVTGLIWEMKESYDGTVNYSNPHDADNKYYYKCFTEPTTGDDDPCIDTKDFVKALNDASFGGFKDWRLPEVQELTTLVDSSIPYPGPTINPAYFPNTQQSSYWSATASADGSGNRSYMWGVYFFSGGVSDGLFYPDPDYDLGAQTCVRAVRGGQ